MTVAEEESGYGASVVSVIVVRRVIGPTNFRDEKFLKISLKFHKIKKTTR